VAALPTQAIARMSEINRRVLLVVPSSTSFHTFFRGVADAWQKTGGELAVAAGPDLPGQTTDWPDSVKRFPLPAFRGGDPWKLFAAGQRLADVVTRWNPAVVHAHFAAGVVAAAVARPVIGNSRRRWVGTFHGLHMAMPGARSVASRLTATAEGWAARRMDTVCVLNREDAVAMRAILPKNRVHVVESTGVGCDLETFDPCRYPAKCRQDLRSLLGIRPDSLVVAYVGRRTAFKGFDVAVRGFMRAGLEQASLLLVGAPDDAHASGLTAAERSALAVDPRVVDAGWQWDVAPYLAVADICLLPSVREGLPVTAMEALAMGVPVVTVDSRGCRDVVRDGIDGFVLPAADADLIAETLRTVSADRDCRCRMAQAAVAGRTRFDRRRYVAAELELYSKELSLLRPRPSPQEVVADD
jgi:glycosyltransferase involved in cell wall biosynthesis